MKHLLIALGVVWGITIVISLLTGCGGADFGSIPGVDASSDTAPPWMGDGPKPAPLPIGSKPPRDAGPTDTGVEAEASMDSGWDAGLDAGFDAGYDSGIDTGSDTGCTPIMHSNGLGQTYLDCSPLGTFDAVTASEAASAWPPGGIDHAGQCTDPISGTPDDCTVSASTPQGVWCYTGSLAGRVNGGLGGCPTLTSPTWD
jgi:hypothetical protein